MEVFDESLRSVFHKGASRSESPTVSNDGRYDGTPPF